MKKILLTAATLISVAYAQNIKIKGSDTVLPLAQKEAEVFNKKSATKISVTGGGSGVGIASLIEGTTDIASSSRRIKMDEKLKLQEAGKKYKEAVIANDALSIIVNNSNPISQLTKEQIEGIFTGKIKNWKELGGADAKIIVYCRESSSGTYEFFKEYVMSRKNYTSSALNMPATGAIVQSVSQTKGAIGYVGMAYDNSSVKQLKVSYDKGKNFIMPSLATAKNKTYPIVRPLFLYYNAKDEAKIMPFINFCLSAEGQAIVEKTGYVPLK